MRHAPIVDDHLYLPLEALELYLIFGRGNDGGIVVVVIDLDDAAGDAADGEKERQCQECKEL
jgi:hypothetical protein